MKKLILLTLVITTMTSFAQQKQLQPTVSVSGEGVVHVEPDQAIIRVQVEHTGSNVKGIKQQNDEVIDAVIKFVRTLKIDKKDIVTERINLNKNYNYNTKKYNYVASQALKIKLKDLKKYEALMEGLMTSGINRINGVHFESSKIEELKAKARIKAIQNAKTKAEAYANALGQRIGKAIVISESSFSAQPPTPIYRTMAVEMKSDNSMETIAVGEMSVKAHINVVFELK
jgi:hypothetical protein